MAWNCFVCLDHQIFIGYSFQENAYLYSHAWRPTYVTNWPFSIEYAISPRPSQHCILWCKITRNSFGYCKRGKHASLYLLNGLSISQVSKFLPNTPKQVFFSLIVMRSHASSRLIVCM